MSTTPLGWPVLDGDDVHRWRIPGVSRWITCHPIYGYLLIVWAVWYNRAVERLDLPGNDAVDEGGYAKRQNVNNPTLWSEHSGGMAQDLNWNRHPNGVAPEKTFTSTQLRKMRRKARRWNGLAGGSVIRLGIDYQGTPDGMHSEWFHKPLRLKKLMRLLSQTSDGKAVLRANPDRADYLRAKGYIR